MVRVPSIASASETLAGRVTWMAKSPSSRRGTNSAPSRARADPDRDEGDRDRRGDHRTLQEEVEHGLVAPHDADDEDVALVRLAQDHRGEHRHPREREHERGAEREEHRPRHGPEHLALDALEQEHRHVDDADDEHPEGDGPPDRARLAEERRAGVELAGGHGGERALDDHHRAVDHQAEVESAEAHQVAAHPERAHDREGAEHGERDRRRDHEARRHVAEEDQEHADDDDAALEQRSLDGGEHLVDEVGAVVERVDPGTLRQPGADLVEARLDLAHRSRARCRRRPSGPCRRPSRPCRRRSPRTVRNAAPSVTVATSRTRTATPPRARRHDLIGHVGERCGTGRRAARAPARRPARARPPPAF